MSRFRIALANLHAPADRDESVRSARDAIAAAAAAQAGIVCFPECFVPGYRFAPDSRAQADAAWLDEAWSRIAAAAADAGVAVILGTERICANGLRISALVIDADGSFLGFQDKVQLDPSEESIYARGAQRSMFAVGELRFGIAICHEGWRYPETFRWAARRGAHVVFHPHLHLPERDGFRPSEFVDPRNTFHEKALLCRAAENTCFVASVNCAAAGSPTTSAVIRPDGTVLCYQPYGDAGLLVTDIDLDAATGELASRLAPAD